MRVTQQIKKRSHDTMIDWFILCCVHDCICGCVHQRVLHYANKPLNRATANTYHRFFLLSFEERVYPVELFDYRKNIKRLAYHGNVYVRLNLQNGVTFWRCVNWTKGCRARIPTRLIGGYTTTHKTNDEIIHTHHLNSEQ